MTTLLIIIASLAAAYLASRLSRREPFGMADLVTGGLGALVGLSMAEFHIGAHSAGHLGVPLLFACGLTIGLIALRRPTPQD
jgi:hypothetical protein